MKKVTALLILLSFTKIAYSQMREGKVDQYTLAARPLQIGIDAQNTAIIVVDMQNGFLHKRWYASTNRNRYFDDSKCDPPY